MQKIIINFENCYGIKKLESEFIFSEKRAYAIYAPNGAMKTSMAQTFKDIADEVMSKDRIFPTRPCTRKVVDENNLDLSKEQVLVISPYDEVLGHSEKTSTLLVDSKLRTEYEELYLEVDKSKESFLKVLREQSKSKKDIEKEISSAFTRTENDFFIALIRVKNEVLTQKDAPFANIHYDTVFDEKVLAFLGTKDVKTAIENYIKKYNELLEASTYFKKGIFNYYNAATVAKSLSDNGFFDAKHSINLNADQKLEITSQDQLEELITKEKDGISNDKELRKKFAAIEKLLHKNVTMRDFEAYLIEHEEVLSELTNIEKFREDVWKSYFKAQMELYEDLITKYEAVMQRQKEIEEEAGKQRTQWERVIDIFNDRFFVPFKLVAKNKIPVILGQEPMLSLGFIFDDGVDQAPIEKTALMQVLSTGEKKAFYVLNIIFEVEARKKAGQETIFIIDDIADSFDYKNKYAIIQYLKDISEEPYFYQIILTHNFDFFRTVNNRFIDYSHCLMALKNSDGILLKKAAGIKNIFVKDWKPKFFTDRRKRIASIPFIRNLIEFTKGDQNPDYVKLTALLHWKKDSATITEENLDQIYNSVFGTNEKFSEAKNLVVETIQKEAMECLGDGESINFENKIVLSIAIRIAAEKFMVQKINDDTFIEAIDSNQTPKLLTRFKEIFGTDNTESETIQRVILMTPENIHLNSFMYEPIMDMSDEHLRKLYKEVTALK